MQAWPRFGPFVMNVPQQALRWVLRLRWALVAMVLALAVLAHTLLEVVLPVLPMAALLLAWAGFNGLAQYCVTRGLPRPGAAFDAWVAGHLAVDILVLTLLLYWTGGATNPFVSFYLPLLGLAAVFLPWLHGVLLGVLSVACYTALMLWYLPLELAHPHQAAHHHVQGMWLNFVLSAVVLMGLVARLGMALRQRDEALMWAHLRLAADERLAALGNGFAATAHQLGTPLSVLSMMVADWQELAAQEQAASEIVLSKADLLALAQPVQQMQQVLHDLRARVQPDPQVAGSGRNGLGPDDSGRARVADTNLYAWLLRACADWRNTCPDQVLRLLPWPEVEQPWVPVPEHVLAIAFKVLLDNAMDAHTRQGWLMHGQQAVRPWPIVLHVCNAPEHWVLGVQDQGGGVSPALLTRLGYEIVESKASQGMGLYLLNALLMRWGGFLQIKNIEGGALVLVHFPKVVL